LLELSDQSFSPILLIFLGQSTASPASVLFVDSAPDVHGKEQPVGISLDDVRNIIKHNMGYLTEDLSGKEGQIEAINQYGNQDAL